MTTRKALIKRIKSMQLGTQEMLDAAADDALLIPFGTLFADKEGSAVAREANELDDERSVKMCGIGAHSFYDAANLRPMSEN